MVCMECTLRCKGNRRRCHTQVAHIENWLRHSVTHALQEVQEVEGTAPGEDRLAELVDEFSGTSSLWGVQKQNKKREEHWELQQEEHSVHHC